MVFWLGEKLVTSFFTLWSLLTASPRVMLLTWKPSAGATADAAVLAAAGAAVTYVELPDLAHAYPRELNPRILAWVDAVVQH